MSCIELLEKWGYKVDCESRLPIADVIRAGKEGKLEEVFGTGTAAVISPVGELRYEDEVLTINGFQTGPVTQRLYDTLTGIPVSYTHLQTPRAIWVPLRHTARLRRGSGCGSGSRKAGSAGWAHRLPARCAGIPGPSWGPPPELRRSGRCV